MMPGRGKSNLAWISAAGCVAAPVTEIGSTEEKGIWWGEELVRESAAFKIAVYRTSNQPDLGEKTRLGI